VDALDLGSVEQLHELPGVGRKGLYIAPLALGVKGFEDERGLACAAKPGDHGELADGQIEIEALQVVLAHTAQLDRCILGYRHEEENLKPLLVKRNLRSRVVRLKSAV